MTQLTKPTSAVEMLGTHGRGSCDSLDMLGLVAQGQVKSQAQIMWLPSVKVGRLKECKTKIRAAPMPFPAAVGTGLKFQLPQSQRQ